LVLVAAAQGGVFSRRQALNCGSTPEQIREHLVCGRWERVRHGQYAEVHDSATLTPWERRRAGHRRGIHAAVNSRRPGSVAVSHQSALVLHGLPDWGLSLDAVHLTRLDDRGGSRGAGVQEHVGRLSAQDLALADGRTVTTVPRAVIETACTSSLRRRSWSPTLRPGPMGSPRVSGRGFSGRSNSGQEARRHDRR
jgi:hypothetical protein